MVLGGIPQTTNSYGYDASGNRIRMATSGLLFTNSVSPGYRIQTVYNAATGATTASYGYDKGGRVTSIARSGTTLGLGYNSFDQVIAVTNGSSWVVYQHDAIGRRTKSTDSSGIVRQFIVAPTPGSDLQSPQSIVDVNGALQEGYIYLGDTPISRYTSGGSAGFYLEDGMGSVIGIAPAGNPTPANTTCLFYDGFGNSRATNGPAPAFPSGASGDFRFQGAWLEADSGFYNMRAREYDPQTGRFTSRDSAKPVTDTPETFHPYCFAANNPMIYRDATGHDFTLVEFSVSEMIDTGLEALKNIAIQKAKSEIEQKIVNAFLKVAVNEMSVLYPQIGQLMNIFKGFDAKDSGLNHQFQVMDKICNDTTAGLARYVWMEVGVTPDGTPQDDGLHCPIGGFPSIKSGVKRVDMVLGESAPHTESGDKAMLDVELKLSGNSLYNQYVIGSKKDQLDAILNYCDLHTTTHIAVFFTVFSGSPSKLAEVKQLILRKGLDDKDLAIVISARKTNQ